jgi:hypothetical protein
MTHLNILILIYFRIEMEVNSDHIENFESMNEKIKSDDKIIELELEVKIEKMDETGKIKTEFFEERNISEPLQIVGEKQKNRKRSNLEIENKKIKEEFVVYGELDDKLEPKPEPEEINFHDLFNQVIKIYTVIVVLADVRLSFIFRFLRPEFVLVRLSGRF